MRKTIQADLCDLDHEIDTPASDTLAVEIDGERHDLDLCAQHYKLAVRAYRPFTGAGRTSAARKARGVLNRTAAQRRAADEIRQWAREQGFDVAEKGRLPGHVKTVALEHGIGLEVTETAGRR